MFTRHLCTICHGLGTGEQGRACPYASVHRAATAPKEPAMHNITSPRTDDDGIEAEIQAKGLTAPRITPVDIDHNIASEYYFTAADGNRGSGEDLRVGDEVTLSLLTFCVLILKNGFTVTGESACASPENFDADVGRKIARANAVNKVWPLMGYQLKSELARD